MANDQIFWRVSFDSYRIIPRYYKDFKSEAAATLFAIRKKRRQPRAVVVVERVARFPASFGVVETRATVMNWEKP